MSPARVLAAVLLLALPACKKDEAKPGGAAAPGTGAATAGAAVQAAKVAIALDEKVLAERAMLTAAPAALEQAVPGLPPVAQWIAVQVIDDDGQVTAVIAPAKNHPGAVPALAADGKGVRFGLLRDGKLEQVVERVARVTVKTTSDAGKPVEGADHGDHGAAGAGGMGGGDSGGGGDHGGGANQADKGVRATPTADLRIEIETPSGASSFTGDKMVGLPEVKAPSGDTETPGWDLRDVLRAAGVGEPKVVVLTDEANASLRIEAGDWDPAKVQHYLKLNKSGQLRFRTFRKTGDVWEVAGELRGIKRIKLP